MGLSFGSQGATPATRHSLFPGCVHEQPDSAPGDERGIDQSLPPTDMVRRHSLGSANGMRVG
jgi:hypothetical protein